MRLISSQWVWQQVWLASQGLNAPGLVLHIHKNTNTHIHTNKCTERKRRDRRQAANNRTKTKQKWLVDEDWRTVTDTVLKHTPTCQGVEILQMYWGFSSFISIFVTREKKKEKMLHPTLSILKSTQDVKRKEVTESNRCLVKSSIQAPSYGKLDVSLSLGIFQMQLITNTQYLTNVVAVRGVQFGSLGFLPVCYSS